MNLPEDIRKNFAASVKADKNELSPLRLAGEGWKEALRDFVEKRLSSLNTPNTSNLIELFRDVAGVDMTATLQPHKDALRAFIKKRGDIAHRGADAGHVSIRDLESDYNFICELVVELDNALIEPVRALCRRRPWNQRGQQ